MPLYALLHDPKNPTILLAINQEMSETVKISANLRKPERGEYHKVIGPVGYITLEHTIHPFFHLENSNLVQDTIDWPLRELAALFCKEGQVIGRHPNLTGAIQDGPLARYHDRFDWQFEGGLDKLLRNVVIDGDIHAIHYHSIKESKGINLEYSRVSAPYRTDTTTDFSTQLFGFIKTIGWDVQFRKFRRQPGRSGWDCDVAGAHAYGVKYHRVEGSTTKDYSFSNNVGSFKCALGILQDAKMVQVLSIDETSSRFS